MGVKYNNRLLLLKEYYESKLDLHSSYQKVCKYFRNVK